MKNTLTIVSLNSWGGRVGEKLIDFFKNNQDVDIFCLQEIFNCGKDDPMEISEHINTKDYSLLSKIKEALSNHVAYFRPAIKEYYGLAMFIKKDVTVKDEGELFVHKDKGYIPEGDLGFHARNIQHATLSVGGTIIEVINFHGLWNGMGKSDTEDRLKQSEKILSFVEKLEHNFVVCGDFNLLPETDSLKIFENSGLRNLIKENGIQSTRTSLYTKQDTFADYVFISEGVDVQSFEIMKEEVSDHAAMKLVVSL